MNDPSFEILCPDWPDLPTVGVFTTTRAGGVSRGPYADFNLGLAAGDRPDDVAENRRRLRQALPGEPCWLRQVHGNRVIDLDDWTPDRAADAAWTSRPGRVAAVLTADCLPVVLADEQGGAVAVAHAGWRGLAAEVLLATVQALQVPPQRLRAWIGPGISQPAYEVDAEMAALFMRQNPALGDFFAPDTQPGKRRADLVGLARWQLQAAGVKQVSGGEWCTYGDAARFFSHRRDPAGGRMATVAWLRD